MLGTENSVFKNADQFKKKKCINFPQCEWWIHISKPSLTRVLQGRRVSPAEAGCHQMRWIDRWKTVQRKEIPVWACSCSSHKNSQIWFWILNKLLCYIPICKSFLISTTYPHLSFDCRKLTVISSHSVCVQHNYCYNKCF